ncbi:hypothetical protein BIV08_13185 [Pseudomonas sp. AF76]|nr:hypothetical protein BIV08_13185 [Pseudomonas sp. AF76]
MKGSRRVLHLLTARLPPGHAALRLCLRLRQNPPACADAMVSDLAFELDGSRRHVAHGIQQLIELGTLLANRALDNVEPR